MIPGEMMGLALGETKDLTAAAKLPAMIDRAANAILDKAKSITISTDQDYIAAGEFGVAAKAELDNMEAERVKMKAPFLAGGKGVDDHYRLALGTLEKAIAQVKSYMGAYNEKKRIAAAAEAKRIAADQEAKRVEAKRLEDEALARVREEEQARVRAAEAKASEERARREEAEAETRRAVAERQAAEASAAGDRASAAMFEQRAADSAAQAEQAKQDAATERQKAIDAKRAQLKAERETAQAVATVETANQAVADATRATPGTARVAGANDRITLKWRWKLLLPEGADVQSMIEDARIHASWLKVDEEKIDAMLNKVKDKKLALKLLGPSFEVWTEEQIALKKGSKT